METEKATRTVRIDPRLAAAGWTVVDAGGSFQNGPKAVRELET
jgi:hypothetical protein